MPTRPAGGEPALALEAFARREGPVVRERTLQVGDDRAVDPEVHAADRVRGRARQPVALADVHAAREAELAVDHEDLAVMRRLAYWYRRGTRVGRNAATGTPASRSRRIIVGFV